MGFPRQEYWSGLAFLSPGDLPDPGMEHSACISRWILYHWVTSEAIGICEHALKGGEGDKQFGVIDNRLLSHKHADAQSCPTLCNPMNCSPPGSSVYEISQARLLEWVDIFSFRGSSQPKDWTWVSCIAGRFLINLAMREAHILILEIYKILTHPITHSHLPPPHTLTYRDIEQWRSILTS